MFPDMANTSKCSVKKKRLFKTPPPKALKTISSLWTFNPLTTILVLI